MPLRVVLGIDIEPDPRRVYRADDADFRGLRATLDVFRELRRRLARHQSTVPGFVWLVRMDQQIRRVYGACTWIGDTFARDFEELDSAGDDVGLHTHLFRWDDERDDWTTDAESTDWMRLCVDEAAAAFRSSFGRACTMHSFGDRLIGEAGIDAIERHDMLLDMTVEPGLTAATRYRNDEHLHGTLPDFSRAPRSLWRPSADDYLSDDPASPRRLHLLPVATYRFPIYFEPGRRIELALRRMRGDALTQDDKTQRFVRVGCSQRSYVFRRACALLMQEFAPPAIHMVLRSNQAGDPAEAERLVGNLEWLAGGGLGVDVEFVSASRLLALQTA